ncbi:bifunctional GTP diphosphokinase/guanosine-3',5'-bis pyrophosphate 3'-pyrophosphohydrolase [Ectothiorhodospira lacustris]|uniref:bifunctional GTP diphosphokinase/guanosine-3',5'-bis pyrophosphate 3'-pyrophosphohydrolase n=1 Tax=Ectothiorhodospira lacustris TaxID=2899127 RepID=UPI001EE943A7|nr:bifunctional GTP diphosphokinase/guanosine-3',5'-bis pyrophosphate 3'-pyrophosphohydrolase [Ectothiorhodospira lacustris]MCG5499884.1 bifunctional GTP diphosphokinase/guanosine-3',5'-bis pyrophosphate 3'-pyrophosphohydrolase [Ectothiorhodospira lacustris]MCG5509028.1 bifunctional GTP diphosphokinase/guanosine-3',5'-bis pyrophosphate 3'-pyrophosphohydrolase [Ectothiorhodospira lacustris]MCG5520819.1 bifunctional GTP diphosphokinase/guanosine-3',5'-bis pyrophosphate 3'-pyrophosphohydrolase [Ect
MVESAPTPTIPSPQPLDTTRFMAGDLCAYLECYLEPEQIKEVYRAYLFGAEAHEGQTRQSGEPYIFHPLAVAKTMAEMRMDYKSIIAAILHDVMEDTHISKERIIEEFGDDVAELVDGVSKLTHLKFRSKAEAQAENFRKMMLAITRDLRVILVKLADRLHNMRTLGALRPDKSRRVARETLDIYAPIAQRLGMNAIRRELELLGFAAHYPMRHKVLEAAVKKSRGHRKEVMQKIETAICGRMEEVGIEARIVGREKNLYSIYRKMKQKRLSFSEVYDVFAIRIIVADVDTCYRALGAVHNLYKPVPGRFKDYIAIPKANGYQSLHTVLFGPHGIPIEVQIRTEEMDRVAETGIAAHWLYKAGDRQSATAQDRAQDRAREWLKGVLEIQQAAGNSMEFLENVKVDLFPEEVYIFTPQGDIMELSRGATVVDFAYAVHSDVGNTCVAAKIDRRLAPLSTPLESGRTVQIITAPGARPNPAWLNFVVTGKARTAIRHYLKNLQQDEAVSLGRRLLEKALSVYELSLEQVPEERLRALLEELQLPDVKALLADVGLGNRMAALVARRLSVAEDADASAMETTPAGMGRPLAVKGTEGMVLSFAKCCNPIPGDPIVGVMSTGRGLVVHREHCRNVADYRDKPDKWITVEWAPDGSQEYAASVRIQTANKRGVLASLAAGIADMGSNIEHVSFDERDGHATTITFTLSVRNRKHLADMMRRLRRIPEVLRIVRAKG